MNRPSSSRRWEFGLPLAAIAVGALIVILAWLATSAREERHAFFLEGQQLRLAQRMEGSLRDSGPQAAESILLEVLSDPEAVVQGFILLKADGTEQLRAGQVDGKPTLEVNLFVGANWVQGTGGPTSGGPGRGRGRRLLQFYGSSGEERLPAAERMLFPVAVISALSLVGLAILGGRLLRRQAMQVGREATRRRLEGLGRAGAGLAHQLRTPLATIKGRLQLELEKDPHGGNKRLQMALQESTRMEALLNQLLDYARPPEPQPKITKLSELGSEFRSRNSRVRWQVADEVEVFADSNHVREMLSNLIDNALRADEPDGEVVVTAAQGPGQVTVSVADRGPGPGDDPERFFEPYITGRADGTGLGLPITRALAEVNGGSVELRPHAAGGTVATLTLPAPGESR